MIIDETQSEYRIRILEEDKDIFGLTASEETELQRLKEALDESK